MMMSQRNYLTIRDVKNKYWDTLKSRRFVGILPKTLDNVDINVLKEYKPLLYLLKSDGERRIIYVVNGSVYLIDRKNYITIMHDWSNDVEDKSIELILDSELIMKGSKPYVRIFDILFINGRNVEHLLFMDRMRLVTEFVCKMQEQNKFKFMMISEPYRIEELQSRGHCNSSGDICKEWESVKIDGIVVMTNSGYLRGTSVVCTKHKNACENTIDFQCMNIRGGVVELMVFDSDKKELVKFSETCIGEDEFEKFEIGEWKIIEFSYRDMRFTPYRCRNEKQYPNSLKTASNVWDTITNPVNILDLVNRNRVEVPKKSEVDPLQTIVMQRGLSENRVVKSSRVIKSGKKINGRLMVKNSDGEHIVTVLSSKAVLSKEQLFKHNKMVENDRVRSMKEKTMHDRLKRLQHLQILKRPTEIRMNVTPSVVCKNSDVKNEFKFSENEVACQTGVYKFSNMLNLYLENYDENCRKSEIEVEFKFGLLTSSGKYNNGISKGHFEKILGVLTEQFDSRNISRIVSTDYISKDSQIRKTIYEPSKQCVDISKRKLRTSTGVYYEEFTTGTDIVLRGTVSVESKIRGFHVGMSTDGWLIRRKERVQFKMNEYFIDLTKVITDNIESYELEIELRELDIIKMEDVFNGNTDYGGLSRSYVCDIFEGINYIINGILYDSDDKLSDRRVGLLFNRDPLNGGDGIFRMNTDNYARKSFNIAIKSIKHITSSSYLKLSESMREHVLLLSRNYFKNIFEINRSEGGILKGKSKLAIMYAIVYVCLMDSGINISISNFAEFVVTNVSEREFIKANGLVEKYVIRIENPQEMITTDMYLERLISRIGGEAVELYKYKNNIHRLYMEIRPYLNDVALLKMKCNELVIICLYVHVKWNICLDKTLVILQTKISRDVRYKCIQRMKVIQNDGNLLDNSYRPDASKELFEISELQLNLITVSSGLFDEHSRLRDIGAKMIKFKDSEKEQLKLIIESTAEDPSAGSFVTDSLEKEYVRSILRSGVKELDEIAVTNGCRVIPGVIRSETELLIYCGVFKIINLEGLFEDFGNTVEFHCIRYGTHTKTYNNLPAKIVHERKEKLANFKVFQNTVQISLKLPVEHTGQLKEYDVKVFSNGKLVITGCTDVETPNTVAQMVISKINETNSGISTSELSKMIGQKVEIPECYKEVKFSNINASAKSNLKLSPTREDQFGLKRLLCYIKDNYGHILVPETHLNLKSNQMPIRLPPPDLKSGKRVIMKILSELNNITTIQIHTSGSINFSGKSEKELKNAYDIIYNILKEFNQEQ